MESDFPTSNIGAGFLECTVFHNISGDAGTVTSAITPNKLNSCSPTAAGLYASTLSANGTSRRLVTGDLSAVSFQRYVFSSRYAPEIGMNTADFFSIQDGTKGSSTLIAAESPGVSVRRSSRRFTKLGYAPMYGNYICRHAKTGSNAYGMIMPHFHNDITWINQSDWQNGMAQSDVWNMQLFSSRRRLNVT